MKVGVHKKVTKLVSIFIVMQRPQEGTSVLDKSQVPLCSIVL